MLAALRAEPALAGALTSVSTGDEAVLAAQAEPYDVAVVPAGGGLALVARLREVCPRGAIVVLGGDATASWTVAALRAGAFVALPSSACAEDLASAVGLALARVALERDGERAARRRADAEALAGVGSLARGLAHEIRNPLNAAVLQLQLLGRGVDRLDDAAAREKLRERVAIVTHETRRLERLIQQFLEVARPRALRPEALDLASVVRGVLEVQAEAIARRSVRVEAALPDAASIDGDRERIAHVVTSLVANALEAMTEPGVLTLRVGAHASGAFVEVGDTGCGIAPDALARVFDPFFTTKEAAAGLGLAIVRTIVQQHGGCVAIDSAPGRGTRVTVELPGRAVG